MIEVRTQAELDVALTGTDIIDCIAGVLRAVISGTVKPRFVVRAGVSPPLAAPAAPGKGGGKS